MDVIDCTYAFFLHCYRSELNTSEHVLCNYFQVDVRNVSNLSYLFSFCILMPFYCLDNNFSVMLLPTEACVLYIHPLLDTPRKQVPKE